MHISHGQTIARLAVFRQKYLIRPGIRI
jgi:hypothetical protein